MPKKRPERKIDKKTGEVFETAVPPDHPFAAVQRHILKHPDNLAKLEKAVVAVVDRGLGEHVRLGVNGPSFEEIDHVMEFKR